MIDKYLDEVESKIAEVRDLHKSLRHFAVQANLPTWPDDMARLLRIVRRTRQACEYYESMRVVEYGYSGHIAQRALAYDGQDETGRGG